MKLLPRTSLLRRIWRQALAAGLAGAFCAVSWAADPLSVCFVYSNPIGESGWTYQQELARRYLVEHMGDKITTKYVENIPEGPDAERVMRNFVQQGCKVIFSPSFGFMEPTFKVARTKPKDVIFLNGTGYKTLPNLGVYNARYDEARYLEGVIAASMSKSGDIGYIGAYPIPEVLQGINAFARGVQSVNPEARVRLVWVNAWYDPGKERDAANALIKFGSDVLAYATSGVSIVTTGEEKGVYTLGYYSDVSKFGPKTNLTSIEMIWGPYYESILNEVLAGNWKSGNYIGNMADGIVRLSPLNEVIPDAVRERVERDTQAIISGELKVFAGPVVDQDGKVQVAEGEVITQEQLDNMNYLVQGIDGLLPKN